MSGAVEMDLAVGFGRKKAAGGKMMKKKMAKTSEYEQLEKALLTDVTLLEEEDDELALSRAREEGLKKRNSELNSQIQRLQADLSDTRNEMARTKAAIQGRDLQTTLLKKRFEVEQGRSKAYYLETLALKDAAAAAATNPVGLFSVQTELARTKVAIQGKDFQTNVLRKRLEAEQGRCKAYYLETVALKEAAAAGSSERAKYETQMWDFIYPTLDEETRDIIGEQIKAGPHVFDMVVLQVQQNMLEMLKSATKRVGELEHHHETQRNLIVDLEASVKEGEALLEESEDQVDKVLKELEISREETRLREEEAKRIEQAGKALFEGLVEKYNALLTHAERMEAAHREELDREKGVSKMQEEERARDEEIVRKLNDAVKMLSGENAKLRVRVVWKDLATKMEWGCDTLPESELGELEDELQITETGGSKLQRKRKTIEMSAGNYLKVIRRVNDRNQMLAEINAKKAGAAKATAARLRERMAELEISNAKLMAAKPAPRSLLVIRQEADEIEEEIEAAREQYGEQAGLDCKRCTMLFVCWKAAQEESESLYARFMGKQREMEAAKQEIVDKADEKNRALAAAEASLKAKLDAADQRTKKAVADGIAKEALLQAQFKEKEMANERRTQSRTQELERLKSATVSLENEIIIKDHRIKQLETMPPPPRSSASSSNNNNTAESKCGTIALQILAAVSQNVVNRADGVPVDAAIAKFYDIMTLVTGALTSRNAAAVATYYDQLAALMCTSSPNGELVVFSAFERATAVFSGVSTAAAPVAVDFSMWKDYAIAIHPMLDVVATLTKAILKPTWRSRDKATYDALRAEYERVLLPIYSRLHGKKLLVEKLNRADITELHRLCHTQCIQPAAKSLVLLVLTEAESCIDVNTHYSKTVTRELAVSREEIQQLKTSGPVDTGMVRSLNQSVIEHLQALDQAIHSKVVAMPMAAPLGQALGCLKMAWDYVVKNVIPKQQQQQPAPQPQAGGGGMGNMEDDPDVEYGELMDENPDSITNKRPMPIPPSADGGDGGSKRFAGGQDSPCYSEAWASLN